MIIVEKLAEWVPRFEYCRLSETAVRHAKLLLLDAIGRGLGALGDPEFRRASI